MKLPALFSATLCAGLLSVGFASPQAGNQPPDCTDQGDYLVECQGLTTSLIVTSSATDPDGDPLSYQWFSCPLAFVTDPTAQTTEIILDTSTSCDIRCGVRIQVTDPSGESTVCRLYFVVVPGTSGCSPGYWKNHVTAWADTPFAPSDDFDTVFGVDAFNPDRTLLTALRSGGGGLNKLGRMGVAALLNATDRDVPFPLAVGQVINKVHNAIVSGHYEPLATTLDGYDNLGCTQN